MKMINKASGEAVYFNPIKKHGKDAWIIQGIGATVVIGRDRQKLKSRTFTQYPRTALPGPPPLLFVRGIYEGGAAAAPLSFFHWKKRPCHGALG